MKLTITIAALAAATATATHAQFASGVEAYTPGTGYQIEFGSNIPITDPTQALGAPTTSNPGQFGGPVDPFNPPYLASQIVSMGAGGSLTVRFDAPIQNNPANPFGLDFIIFGNAGFIITNGEFNQNARTDGSLFGAAEPTATRVSVSADNVQFYQLDGSISPAFDRYFPTDAAGNPQIPVNPLFANEGSFNNAGYTGIRDRYAGSAGGTGYDLAWARDNNNNPIALDSIRYIRVDVLSGSAEIDSFAVVPEPASAALLGLGALVLMRKRR